MNEIEKHIVIMAFQNGVVVKGIERKLDEAGYTVDVIEDMLNLSHYITKAGLFLIYLPAEINNSGKDQVANLIEKISAGERNMVFIGETKYHNELVRTVPALGNYMWLDKPVDMIKMRQAVDEAIANKKPGGGKKRILIVDDDPSYAKMVREWIKDIYRTDIVTAGMQAISFLLKVKEDEKVDLILLDYEMPVVDGPQVLQMLRQDPATEKIPVIFLTGNGSKEAVTRVMELKPNGYVLKSTTRDDLITYLRGKLK